MSEDRVGDFRKKPFVIETKDNLTAHNFHTLSFKDIAYCATSKTKIHGYPNLVKNTGLVKQLTWLCLCVVITAVFLYNFGALVGLYYKYQVSVNRELIHTRELRFPGVTLCNTNPIKKSRLNLSESVSSVVLSIQGAGGEGQAVRRRRRGAPASYDPCTTDYHPDTGSCFWHVSNKVDATTAAAGCASESFGGHLAKVPSDTIKTYLTDNNLFAGTDHILIGMNDEAVEMTFVWHDGSSVNWSDWALNFPVSDTDRNCVIYNNQLTRKWEVTSCSSPHNYLCEVEVHSAGDSQCTSGTYGTSNSCFWYVAVPRTVEVAKQQCAVNDGRLAVIDSQGLKSFIQSNLISISQSFWIGVDDEEEEGQFVWEDGRSSWTGWTDWPVDPYTSDTDADCVQYDAEVTSWTEVSCFNEAHFVCEYVYPTPGDLRCTTSYFATTNSCFWGVATSSTAEEAQANCAQYDARLAKVHTEEVRTFLVNQNVFIDTEEWLVGLNDSAEEGSFVWSDGSTQDWEDWKSDSTNAVGRECATYVYTTELVYKLQHVSCTGYFQHICEYVYKTESESTTSSESITTSNPSGSDDQGSHDGTIASHLPWSHLPDREEEREDFRQESDVMEALADEAMDIKRDMGYSLEELVLDCQFDQEACYRNFGYFYDNKYGNCFVFNALTVENEYITSSIQGDSHGLSLLVHINQLEYIEGLSKAAGAITVIHPQSHMPFPEDYGILAKPGHVTSIGVKKLTDVKLGGQYGECDESPEGNWTRNVFEEHHNVNYSLQACYSTCYQRHVTETCGCADPMYPMRGQAFTGFSGHSCKNRDLYEDNCKYYISQKYARGELQCDCPEPCVDEGYSIVTTYAQWPAIIHYDYLRDKYPDILGNVSDEYIENNILRIEVYYEDINYLLNEQYPKYPGGKLLSDIGGIMTLWLGCTVVTLSEALVLLIDLLVVAVCKAKLYYKNRKTGDTKCDIVTIVRQLVCCRKLHVNHSDGYQIETSAGEGSSTEQVTEGNRETATSTV